MPPCDVMLYQLKNILLIVYKKTPVWQKLLVRLG